MPLYPDLCRILVADRNTTIRKEGRTSQFYHLPSEDNVILADEHGVKARERNNPRIAVMGVSGRKLVFLDSSGQLKPLFRLPGVGMSLVPGNGDSLLLFGREDKGTWALYTIRPGRKVSLLLRSPKPITAAAETSSHILVVIDGALFLVEHGELRLLAGEPKGTLTAVAADPDGKAIFVSDDRRIFRVNNRRLTVVADGFGGTLRWQRGGLLVFDPRRPLLVRLVRVE